MSFTKIERLITGGTKMRGNKPFVALAQATLTVVAAAGIVAVASPAQADCGHPWSDKD